MKKFKKAMGAIVLSSALVAGGAGVAQAVTFGNSLNGASSVEVLEVKYNGAAWNYKGSGYKNAWFKYTRGGRVLLTKTAKNGKVKGSVWDSLTDWSKKGTTKFSWGHAR